MIMLAAPTEATVHGAGGHGQLDFMGALFVFMLATFIGFMVIQRVSRLLHTPLMSLTNAISAIIIVGAMLAAGLTEGGLARGMGVFAVALAAVNVFGGFLVTRRMLEMFKKKDKKAAPAKAQGDVK